MDLTESWPKGGGRAEAGEEGGEKRKRRPKKQVEKREATLQSFCDHFWDDWEEEWGSAEEWRQESWHATKLGLLSPFTTIPMLFKVMSEENFSEDLSDLAVREQPGRRAAESEEAASSASAQLDGELKDVASFAATPIIYDHDHRHDGHGHAAAGVGENGSALRVDDWSEVPL